MAIQIGKWSEQEGVIWLTLKIMSFILYNWDRGAADSLAGAASTQRPFIMFFIKGFGTSFNSLTPPRSTDSFSLVHCSSRLPVHHSDSWCLHHCCCQWLWLWLRLRRLRRRRIWHSKHLLVLVVSFCTTSGRNHWRDNRRRWRWAGWNKHSILGIRNQCRAAEFGGWRPCRIEPMGREG